MRVVHHYGSRPDFVVLGGLVPELLCAGSGRRHAGTVDIDVQVDLEIAGIGPAPDRGDIDAQVRRWGSFRRGRVAHRESLEHAEELVDAVRGAVPGSEFAHGHVQGRGYRPADRLLGPGLDFAGAPQPLHGHGAESVQQHGLAYAAQPGQHHAAFGPAAGDALEDDLELADLTIAAGEKLPYSQADVQIRGHAIECRINAEDARTFMPSPGPIRLWHPPGGPGIRVDSHVYSGYSVPPHYDSLIGKLIAHGDTRETAIARMRNALAELVVEGIKTNTALHQEILAHAAFQGGGLDIHYLERRLGLK